MPETFYTGGHPLDEILQERLKALRSLRKVQDELAWQIVKGETVVDPTLPPGWWLKEEKFAIGEGMWGRPRMRRHIVIVTNDEQHLAEEYRCHFPGREPASPVPKPSETTFISDYSEPDAGLPSEEPTGAVPANEVTAGPASKPATSLARKPYRLRHRDWKPIRKHVEPHVKEHGKWLNPHAAALDVHKWVTDEGLTISFDTIYDGIRFYFLGWWETDSKE